MDADMTGECRIPVSVQRRMDKAGNLALHAVQRVPTNIYKGRDVMDYGSMFNGASQLTRRICAWFLILSLAALGFAGPARAQHRTGAVYVSPILAHWMLFQHQNNLNNGFLWGARIGVDIMPTLAVEAFGMRAPSEVDNITDRLPAGITTIDAAYDAYGIGLRLNMPGYEKYVPFLAVSGGQARGKFDAPIRSIDYELVDVAKTEKRNLFMFGAGMEVFLTRNVALRFEAQDHYIHKDFIAHDGLGDTRTHNWEIGAGVTLLFGGKKQAAEPEHVATRVEVPRRPAPAPAPVPVAVQPVKEAPVAVQPVKWVDSDNDGVPDSMDKCPGTPAGVPVDVNGCKKVLAEEYEIMCLFDYDQSAIKPEFTRALDNLATLLINTGARISVTGYADQAGPRDYNVKLADRRAKAVRDYLVARNVDTRRFDLKAFGEYPIDVNGSPRPYFQRCVQFKLLK
jgi:outer membrane protein OmpA-like peptidoglycan-associated protein